MKRVIVIGGGVIGLTAAWRLAQAGHDVTVLDPAAGQRASWAAAGMLAPVTEAHLGEEELVALNRAAADRWPSFAEELAGTTGMPVDRQTAGTVVAALDEDDRRGLDDLADRLATLGLAVERCRGRDLRRREPALSPGVRHGLDVAGDHAVDNRQVVDALQKAVADAGVALRPVAADGVRGDGGQVAGVTLADGSTEPADTVVVAAGCWSGQLDLPPGARPPVRPVRGEILRLRDDPAAPLLRRVVRGRARGWSVYVVPRSHGEVVVGATSDERGYDTTVTAGGVLDLLRTAADLVPGIRELELVEARAGLRPGTPDNGPIVGATDVAGLVLATGHFRHGILQAPITGDAVAALVADDPVPDALVPFGPGRFAA